MANLLAEPGQTIALSYYATDRKTDLYPKAFIYDTAGNEITTVNLDHVANGYYLGTYAPDGAYEVLKAHIIPYTTAARTTPANYETTEDSIYVKYLWKPQSDTSGFGEVSATISKEDIEKIVEKVKEGLNLEEILIELRKKSEFNFSKDIVKTNIKIPVVNLRGISDKLDKIQKLSSEKIKIKDYDAKFVQMNKQFKDIKESISSEINVLKGNFNSVSKLISAIEMPQLDLKPILGAVDRVLGEQLKNSQQRADLGANIEEAIKESFVSVITNQTQFQTKLTTQFGQMQTILNTLDVMLETLNKEDFRRINGIIEELNKINQFLKVIASMMAQGKLTSEKTDISELMELIKK